ncbi:MAG: Holliday junction resolvase RuvX [Rhodospirillales bacterium]|nr:Holliday junction resolvase RuvX [Rhodospirillales bacterium]
MPLVEIALLAQEIAAKRRLLGLDVGKRTIGLALSDLTLTVATASETLMRTRLASDLAEIADRVNSLEIGGFVVGLPVSMDGQEGPRCQSVRQFASDLLARVDLPLAFWDERLSTAAVERMLIAEADLSRRRRRQVVDRAAAAYILQGALDAIAMAKKR